MSGKRRFFRIWHEDVDAGYFAGWSKGELLVWLVLRRRADANGNCYPGYSDIVEKTGLSRDCIQRAIKQLEARGLVGVHRARKSDKQKEVNRYTLLDLK
jgi:DNA-binding MarR family transcriptional regulator